MSGLPQRPLAVRLWSWNYHPEPTAMGPIATAWVRELRALGHDVSVVAGQPHYPPELFSLRLRVDRQTVEGAPVLRLPLVLGHASGLRRALEDGTYAASALAAGLVLPRRDVSVVVSPSFLALAPAIVRGRVRGEPWILWLQDILPDAATTTGLVRNGAAVAAARALERRAYAEARAIVVPSAAFRENLVRKGVPAEKIELIPNPATPAPVSRTRPPARPPRLLHIGNVGLSQGLERVVACLRASGAPFQLRIAGTGERLAAVRAAAGDDGRISVLGFLQEDELAQELAEADAAVVAQAPGIEEFNVPSRVGRLLAAGLPIVAVVAPGSEVARVLREADAGWTVDTSRIERLPELLSGELGDAARLAQLGANARAYAAARLGWADAAHRFARLLERAAGRAGFTNSP